MLLNPSGNESSNIRTVNSIFTFWCFAGFGTFIYTAVCDKTQSVSVFTALSLTFIFFVSIFSMANEGGNIASSKYNGGLGYAGKLMFGIFFIIFSLTFLFYFLKKHIWRFIIKIFLTKIAHKEVKQLLRQFFNSKKATKYFERMSDPKKIIIVDKEIDILCANLIVIQQKKEGQASTDDAGAAAAPTAAPAAGKAADDAAGKAADDAAAAAAAPGKAAEKLKEQFSMTGKELTLLAKLREKGKEMTDKDIATVAALKLTETNPANIAKLAKLTNLKADIDKLAKLTNLKVIGTKMTEVDTNELTKLQKKGTQSEMTNGDTEELDKLQKNTKLMDLAGFADLKGKKITKKVGKLSNISVIPEKAKSAAAAAAPAAAAAAAPAPAVTPTVTI
jgi:hypothetical protein